MNLPTAVILLCPCCASAVDAETHDEPQDLHCTTCGQTWSMIVNPDRQHTHSLT